MQLDLVSITQGDNRFLSFLSQAIGIVAESDLATENLRWMGDTRFTVGYLFRLLKLTIWPVDIALGIEIEDKEDVKRAYRTYRDSVSDKSKLLSSPTTLSSPDDDDNNNKNIDAKGPTPITNTDEDTSLPPLRFGTVNDPIPPSWTQTPYPNLGNFYAGNMAYMSANSNVFPASLPADGRLDLMMVPGDIPRRRAMQLADDVGRGTLMDQSEVRYVKVSGYRIVPRDREGYISIDGERIPFRGFQAEVHRGLGVTLSRTGRLYEAEGPRGEE
jgi:sphingosine kinase